MCLLNLIGPDPSAELRHHRAHMPVSFCGSAPANCVSSLSIFPVRASIFLLIHSQVFIGINLLGLSLLSILDTMNSFSRSSKGPFLGHSTLFETQSLNFDIIKLTSCFIPQFLCFRSLKLFPVTEIRRYSP